MTRAATQLLAPAATTQFVCSGSWTVLARLHHDRSTSEADDVSAASFEA